MEFIAGETYAGESEKPPTRGKMQKPPAMKHKTAITIKKVCRRVPGLRRWLFRFAHRLHYANCAEWFAI